MANALLSTPAGSFSIMSGGPRVLEAHHSTQVDYKTPVLARTDIQMEVRVRAEFFTNGCSSAIGGLRFPFRRMMSWHDHGPEDEAARRQDVRCALRWTLQFITASSPPSTSARIHKSGRPRGTPKCGSCGWPRWLVHPASMKLRVSWCMLVALLPLCAVPGVAQVPPPVMIVALPRFLRDGVPGEKPVFSRHASFRGYDLIGIRSELSRTILIIRSFIEIIRHDGRGASLIHRRWILIRRCMELLFNLARWLRSRPDCGCGPQRPFPRVLPRPERQRRDGCRGRSNSTSERIVAARSPCSSARHLIRPRRDAPEKVTQGAIQWPAQYHRYFHVGDGLLYTQSANPQHTNTPKCCLSSSYVWMVVLLFGSRDVILDDGLHSEMLAYTRHSAYIRRSWLRSTGAVFVEVCRFVMVRSWSLRSQLEAP